MELMTPVAERDLPRSSITWFLIAYILTVIPQLVTYLPLWIIPVFISCLTWRVLIYKARAQYPGQLMKLLIILFLLTGMLLSYGNFFTTLGCSILLMVLYSLKFIEARTVRDGWILVLLGYFAIAITYLYSSNVFLAIYSLSCFVAITCGALGLQQSNFEHFSNKMMIINVLKMIFMAVPLMAALFIFFPRLPSFMSFAKQDVENMRQTGISDSMTPGDISKLVQDNMHMFWAEFTDYVPRYRDLYWRVLTLDTFDGRSWKQSRYAESVQRKSHYQPVNGPLAPQAYSIIYDPTNAYYLATLDISELINAYSDDFRFYTDFRIEYSRPITTKIRYDLRYFPQAVKEENLYHFQRKMDLLRSVPANGNNRTRAWVQEMSAKYPEPEQLVAAIMTYFRTNDFYYTLEPPLLGEHSVDDFFFTTKQGFCEHYASALTFMLRVANIPSRVVIGYLGGEINPASMRVQVRSTEAHAWVEYWVKDEGWIRVDPTGAIAPERIENGLLGSLSSEESQSLSGGKGGVFGSLSETLVYFKEILEYQWAKLILGYQSDVQTGLFEKFWTNFSWRTLLHATIAVMVIGFFSFALIFLKPWQNFRFDLSKFYRECQQLLVENRGVVLSDGVAPRELVQLAKPHLKPIEDKVLQELMWKVEQYLYKPEDNLRKNHDVIREIKKKYRFFKTLLKRKI